METTMIANMASARAGYGHHTAHPFGVPTTQPADHGWTASTAMSAVATALRIKNGAGLVPAAAVPGIACSTLGRPPA